METPEQTEKNLNPQTEVVDPIHQSYADDLKAQLGDLYTEDLDKYDVKTRIEVMKHMVKVAPKKASKPKSNIPKPSGEGENKTKAKKLPIRGIDWRKYRK